MTWNGTRRRGATYFPNQVGNHLKIDSFTQITGSSSVEAAVTHDVVAGNHRTYVHNNNDVGGVDFSLDPNGFLGFRINGTTVLSSVAVPRIRRPVAHRGCCYGR